MEEESDIIEKDYFVHKVPHYIKEDDAIIMLGRKHKGCLADICNISRKVHENKVAESPILYGVRRSPERNVWELVPPKMRVITKDDIKLPSRVTMGARLLGPNQFSHYEDGMWVRLTDNQIRSFNKARSDKKVDCLKQVVWEDIDKLQDSYDGRIVDVIYKSHIKEFVSVFSYRKGEPNRLFVR